MNTSNREQQLDWKYQNNSALGWSLLGLRDYRIDGRFPATYSHDAEAFDYAQGFTDGPDLVKLERSINGNWCVWTEHYDGDGRWLNPSTGERFPQDD